MARSAKNLREIINVSRLSIRDYSSDEFSSEHEYDEFEELHSYISSRPSSALSSESNFATVMLNTKTGSTQGRYCYTNKHHVPCRPNTAPANNMKGKSPPKKYASGRNTVPFASNNVQSFPSKYTPVPPIVPRNFSKESKSGSISENSQLSNNIKLDIDCLFQYLDATIISGWIESCNDTLNDINIFIVQDNFVEFANFFLNSLSHDQYCKLLELEFSIIIDQLCYLFHAGLHDGRISSKDLLSLADIVMKEYPKALQTKSKGPKLLLDIIIIFCSEKDDTYRNLLKNIKYSTKNKQIVQWLLAIRAFGLIGFVSGILKFYKNILSLQERLVPKEPGSSSHIGLSCTELWCLQAVQRNYCEVVQYLFYHQHIEIKNILDVKERNLLSVAASEGYSEMIKFLMKVAHFSLVSIVAILTLHLLLSLYSAVPNKRPPPVYYF